MKKSILVGISLLAMVATVTVVFAGIRRGAAMSIRFNTRDLPEHGVHIITSADPSFDEMAAKHFKNGPPADLKPLSLFIKNATSKLVLAYALTWELRDESGKMISSQTRSYSEPGVLMGNEILKGLKHTTAIESGGIRCFSRESQIEQDTGDTAVPLLKSEGVKDNVESAIRSRLATELSRTASVTVSLDGVVFDDGSFVGPNRTGYFEQVQAMVSAKVDLLHEIAEASNQGNVEQAFASIAASSHEPDVQFKGKVTADDWYRYFRKLYASEITSKYYSYGKEMIVPYFVKSYERARPSLKRN